jgi:hypothetical protein
MSKDDKFDADKIMAEYNRKAFFTDFPSKDMWAEVRGAQFRRGSDGRILVSIQGTNQQQETVSMWTDLPNAMYLLFLLRQIQERAGAEEVSQPQPPATGNPS